jgi:plastocyanin
VRLLLLSAALIALGVTPGCGLPAGAAPVQTNEVNLPPSYQFDPAIIQVVAATSVTWTNNDHFTHSVKVQDGPDHVIRPGESVTIPLTRQVNSPFAILRNGCSFSPVTHTQSG